MTRRPPSILTEVNRYRRDHHIAEVTAVVPLAWFSEERQDRLRRFGVRLVSSREDEAVTDVCQWYLYGKQLISLPDVEAVDFGIVRDSSLLEGGLCPNGQRDVDEF